jgi:hypothetical protein
MVSVLYIIEDYYQLDAKRQTVISIHLFPRKQYLMFRQEINHRLSPRCRHDEPGLSIPEQ